MDLTQIRADILTQMEEVEGSFAVAFKDLQTGEELLIHAEEQFHAASTMKTPVLIEMYKQANEGKFSLQDSLIVKNEFFSIVDSSTYSMDIGDDSQEGLYQHIGKKLPIQDLAYEMITMSSNLATNILIDLLDAKAVTATMRTLGAEKIQVLRGVEDIKAFEKGLSNSTTAKDLMIIFEKLATGKAVDSISSKEMVNILLEQKFKKIIPAKLAKEVKVAHKTGSITGVRHDSGIVYLADGRKYVLVLLSKEMPDAEKGIELMAEISYKLFQYTKHH